MHLSTKRIFNTLDIFSLMIIINHLGHFDHGIGIKILVCEISLNLFKSRVRDVVFVVFLEVSDKVHIG